MSSLEYGCVGRFRHILCMIRSSRSELRSIHTAVFEDDVLASSFCLARFAEESTRIQVKVIPPEARSLPARSQMHVLGLCELERLYWESLARYFPNTVFRGKITPCW